MRSASGRLAWALPLLAFVAALGGCDRADEAAGEKVLLIPMLAERQDQLESLQLRGAGDSVLVTLRKKDGVWRVGEHGDWPANAGLISQYLFVLSQSHRIEAKTANPKLYSRLGVQPISAADATGSELRLSGGGISSRLLIGNEHTKFDSNYVRIDGQAQTWLTDLPVSFERKPLSWLDLRLIDLPLARIAEVRVRSKDEKPFSLSHRDDRFRLDDAPSAAMRESHQGDALASVLDQLKFEDLAEDDGKARAEREVDFVAVDGLRITVGAWRVGDQLWTRLAASVDEARAAEWKRLSASNKTKADEASPNRIAELNERFRNRRFQLPSTTATTLMLSHDQILAGPLVPPEVPTP